MSKVALSRKGNEENLETDSELPGYIMDDIHKNAF